MSVQFNHTIAFCSDQHRSATFLAELLDRPEPTRVGPFLAVALDNGVTLDFDQVDGDVPFQHYAFLVSEEDFDDIFAKIVERGMRHWADPGKTRSGEINHHDGGRGVYFEDPDRHYLLEILTRPYGSGS